MILFKAHEVLDYHAYVMAQYYYSYNYYSTNGCPPATRTTDTPSIIIHTIVIPQIAVHWLHEQQTHPVLLFIQLLFHESLSTGYTNNRHTQYYYSYNCYSTNRCPLATRTTDTHICKCLLLCRMGISIQKLNFVIHAEEGYIIFTIITLGESV